MASSGDDRQRALAPLQLEVPPEVVRHVLPWNYTPTKYCVLCGRGREFYNSIGNHRFRVLVGIYLEKYRQAQNRLLKGQIVTEIVDTVRGAGGHFAKLQNGEWWEIGDSAAR